MSLSSTSTKAEVNAAYEDNCGYDVEGDVTKARAFVVACRFLIRRMAEEVQHGDEVVKDRYEKIQAELGKAESWIGANDATAKTRTGCGSVRVFSVENFRG